MNTAASRGAEIRSALQVNLPTLRRRQIYSRKLKRRIGFYQGYVCAVSGDGGRWYWGISGGVDSPTCGRLLARCGRSLPRKGY